MAKFMLICLKSGPTCFVLHVVGLFVELGGVDHVVWFAEKREIQKLVLHVVLLAEPNRVAVGLSAREEVNRLVDSLFACRGMTTKQTFNKCGCSNIRVICL